MADSYWLPKSPAGRQDSQTAFSSPRQDPVRGCRCLLLGEAATLVILSLRPAYSLSHVSLTRFSRLSRGDPNPTSARANPWPSGPKQGAALSSGV